MDNLLRDLNQPQQEAVLHKEGPLLIVAGAGAGKTRTITHRIYHLIKNGVDPVSILAVTFTNKAACEMRDRVTKLLSEDLALNTPVRNYNKSYANYNMPFIGTFHALGARILREKGDKIGVRKRFVIRDKDDCKTLIKNIIRDLGYDPDTYEPRKILNIIGKNKGELVSLTNYGAGGETENYFQKVLLHVWEIYERELAREHALDFDDLLLKTVVLLREHEDIREYYQTRWHYIHIDEYQDTNRAQYELSRLLSKKHKNICVVGDIDQCIYGWRGASVKNLLGFEKDYPNAKIVFLEENYRSTGTILQAAHEVIKKNMLRVEKNLFTKNGGGDKISLFISPSGAVEAARVAARSSLLVRSGVKIEDIAVLYRANFQSRALEEACLNINLPYQVVGTRFFERKEIKDVLSFIRGALSKESLSDIKRIINIPPRGIGKVTIAKLFSGRKNSLPEELRKKIEGFYALLEKIRVASEKKSPEELIRYVLKETGVEKTLGKDGADGRERLENIKELVTFAARYATIMPEATPEERLEKFLEDAALATDQDSLLKDGKGVRLMTVHASKGLEFPYVFIVGLEEGLFPHARVGEEASAEDPTGREEEERRLFYVGLTRAEKKIFLSYAQTRIIYGQLEINGPSEFLGDIPPQLIEVEYAAEEAQENIIEFD